MVAGHTRCLVDGCFGIVKRSYRRADVDTLKHLANVVHHSASVNTAQLFKDPDHPVCYFEWDEFLLQFF